MSLRDLDDLTSIEKIKIRGKVPIEMSVFRQIERCNNAISNPDPSIFEAHVRALLALLPVDRREEIKSKDKEFNATTSRWEYKTWCGQNVGTPENPLIDEDTGEILSPIGVEEEITDYERLYEIILGSLQASGLTWVIESKFAEFGRVPKSKIPDSVLRPIEDAISRSLADVRSAHPKLEFKPETSYHYILNELLKRNPQTPIFEKKKIKRWAKKL